MEDINSWIGIIEFILILLLLKKITNCLETVKVLKYSATLTVPTYFRLFEDKSRLKSISYLG